MPRHRSFPRRFLFVLAPAMAALLMFAACGGDDDDDAGEYTFAGGPDGGAFQDFAQGLADVVGDAGIDVAEVAPSDGSVENLQRVNSGEAQFGIAYSGDLFLGNAGRLTGDSTTYTDALPLGALYGGVVHLVVPADSEIQEVSDLAGKRLAPGAEGSGAALAAERYFTHLGMWDEMSIEYIGYADAAVAIVDGELDAFWVLAAVPNDSVIEATGSLEIRLIDVYGPGQQAGFFDEFPFYTQRTLPADTYEGVSNDTPSFQDTALWIANAGVSSDIVEAALEAVFSDDGLAALRESHEAAAETTVQGGLTGIAVPLHPGAQAYWESQDVEIPADIEAN